MTKRRSLKDEDERIDNPRRKRAAFTTPKAATKAIIKRNATVSPLLRLPAELRDKIWGEVLGGRLVHLDRQRFIDCDEDFDTFDHGPDLSENESGLSGNGSGASEDESGTSEDESTTEPNHNGWQHAVCQHDCPENRPDRKVVTRWRDEEDVFWLRPHHECSFRHGDIYSPEPEALPTRSTMHLTVLRASRQIYVEANRILWTTNTFSFRDGVTFSEFMKTRNIHQKRLIQNLRFEMLWGWLDERHWNSALNMALIKSLTGLRTLRLQIVCNVEKELWDHTKDRFVRVTSYTDGLRKLSILPLKSVEVAVGSSRHDRYDGLGTRPWNDHLWKKSDMDQCAEDLKSLLLNPKGAEVYAESQVTAASRRIRYRERLPDGTTFWDTRYIQ
ncbi:MAG: hypothetical protein L6R42_001454 [Xanthoria sp. 1 TBL-2021]|nr:MAG: hypothetical protein L6R42_001454 [Xanthoria sp. 1 TBL-2021]